MTAVATRTTSVDGDVVALVATVSGLSTVATTGKFIDLEDRPQAVSAISLGNETTNLLYCPSVNLFQNVFLGPISSLDGSTRRYCAMSSFWYTPLA